MSQSPYTESYTKAVIVDKAFNKLGDIVFKNVACFGEDGVPKDITTTSDLSDNQSEILDFRYLKYYTTLILNTGSENALKYKVEFLLTDKIVISIAEGTVNANSNTSISCYSPLIRISLADSDDNIGSHTTAQIYVYGKETLA